MENPFKVTVKDMTIVVVGNEPNPNDCKALPEEERKFLKDNEDTILKEHPELWRLKKKLLAIGGCYVQLPREGEMDLHDLLSKGRFFMGRDAELIPHQVCKTPVKGYALGSNGLWQKHTWCVHNGKVIETIERRAKYFGFVVDKG